MRVRPATRDDVPAIGRIARETWRAAYGEILRAETIAAALEEWYDERVLREAVGAPDRSVYVAERAGGVVGYAMGGHAPADGVAVLSAIYVRPARWGEGIGSDLLAAVVEALADDGAAELRLDVLAENEAARAFYEAREFALEGVTEATLFGESVAEATYVREIP